MRIRNLLLGLFVLIALPLAISHRHLTARLETDSIAYFRDANTAWPQPNPFHGPLYPLAVRLFRNAGLEDFGAAKAVSVLSGVLALAAAWSLLRAVAHPAVNVFATLLIVLNPLFLRSSIVAMSDMLALALFLSASALALAPRPASPARAAGCGALLGASILTRYVYASTLVLPLLWLLLRPRPAASAKTALRWSIAAAAGALLVTGPWLGYLYATRGDPLWNQNHLSIAFKLFHREHGSSYFPTSAQYPTLAGLFLDHPTAFLRSWLGTIVELPWALLELFPRIGVLAALGGLLWLAAIGRRKALLLGTLAVYGAAVALVWLDGRFLLPFLPLVAAWIAEGLQRLPERLRGRWPLRRLAMIGVIALLALISARRLQSFFADQAPEYSAAAAWLARQAAPGDSVMAVKPHIAYLSGLEDVFFGAPEHARAGPSDLPAILARDRPTFVVYDARVALQRNPKLRALLEPERRPLTPLLRPVARWDAPQRLVIYRYQ